NGVMGQVVGHVPLLDVSFAPRVGVLFVHNPSHGAVVQVPVAAASSGADSLIGFAIIGAAILSTVAGRKRRKLLWWVAGLALTLLLNFARVITMVALAAIGNTS